MAVTKEQRVKEMLQKYNVTEGQAQEIFRKILTNKKHKLNDKVEGCIVFNLERISIIDLETILKEK